MAPVSQGPAGGEQMTRQRTMPGVGRTLVQRLHRRHQGPDYQSLIHFERSCQEAA